MKAKRRDEPLRALHRSVRPTGAERRLGQEDLLVSKTDASAKIAYANRLFCDIAGFKEPELIGQPHSLVRHPDMPRCVFKLLWERLAAQREIFAYVVNLCKNGDHYWVLAHVTPSLDHTGKTIGYHSNRRFARTEAVKTVSELYRTLRQVEAAARDRKTGLAASSTALNDWLQAKKVSYDAFVLSL